MNDRSSETIDIGRGIKYAKVSARLTEFHSDNAKCAVETSCEFKEGYALFSAKVTTSKGTFTGHSLAKVTSGEKQFEKQETIAVGRALAFAGYLSSGDIACQEEMDEFHGSYVSLKQLNALKNTWFENHREELAGLSKDDLAGQFGLWVKNRVKAPFDAGDFRAWGPEDMEILEALAEKEKTPEGSET